MATNTKLFLILYSSFVIGMVGLVYIFKNTGFGTLVIQSFVNRDVISIAIILGSVLLAGVALKYCIDTNGLLPPKKN